MPKEQREWGEFPTFVSRHDSMEAAIPVRSVFPASFVLHSLASLRGHPLVDALGERAVAFLLAEQGSDGFWRGISTTRLVPPDIDCTCCVLAGLKEWGVDLPTQSWPKPSSNIA